MYTLSYAVSHVIRCTRAQPLSASRIRSLAAPDQRSNIDVAAHHNPSNIIVNVMALDLHVVFVFFAMNGPCYIFVFTAVKQILDGVITVIHACLDVVFFAHASALDDMQH